MVQKQGLRMSLLLGMILLMVGCQPQNNQKPAETTVAETTLAETTLAETTLAETTLAETTVASNPTQEVTVMVTIQVDGEAVFENVELKAHEGDMLLDIMKEQFDVEEKDGFVTAIEGHQQDEAANKFWMFDVNGEMAPVGAAEFKVSDQDNVLWKLEAFE